MDKEIEKQLHDEEAAFYKRHGHYPIGREIEDVVDNVFPQIQREGIKVSYCEVYEGYRLMRSIVEKVHSSYSNECTPLPG